MDVLSQQLAVEQGGMRDLDQVDHNHRNGFGRVGTPAEQRAGAVVAEGGQGGTGPGTWRRDHRIEAEGLDPLEGHTGIEDSRNGIGPDGDVPRRITVSLPAGEYLDLQEMANRRGLSLTQMVRQAIRYAKYLDGIRARGAELEVHETDGRRRYVDLSLT